MFLGLLLVGHFYPEILRWTETTLQDLWGGGGDEGAIDNLAEAPPPWPAIWKSMSYAVGFLILSFVFGFYLVPPIFLATYLIVEANAKPVWAIIAGVVATAILTTGMTLVHIESGLAHFPRSFPNSSAAPSSRRFDNVWCNPMKFALAALVVMA